MVEDSFIENLVVRKNGINGVIYTMTVIALAFILIIGINVVPLMFFGSEVWPITSFFSVAIVFGVVWLLKNQHKEYEFEMSNDVFECASIKGKNRREELLCFSIKECDYIGPVTSERYGRDCSNSNIVIKLTDLKDFPMDEKYWYFCLTHEGLKMVVVFMYKPEMYQVFRRYNPRATKPMMMPKVEKKAESKKADLKEETDG